MISAVCAVVLGVLLTGSTLADRWREDRSQRARIAEIADSLDRFHWAVLEHLAEARHNFLYRDRARPGGEEYRAVIATREAANRFGIPDEVAVYRLADRIIRERDQQALR